MGRHRESNPAAHEGAGWKIGAWDWVPPASPCLHLLSPKIHLVPWLEHDGCTWWAGEGLVLLTALGIAPTGL